MRPKLIKVDISKASNDPKVLKEALAAAWQTMNWLGDRLNEMDVNSDEDIRINSPRFARVKVALGLKVNSSMDETWRTYRPTRAMAKKAQAWIHGKGNSQIK